MRKLLTLLSVCAGVVSYAQSICGGSSTTLTAGNPQGLSNPQYSLNPGGFSPISGTNLFQVSPSATTTYTLYTTGQGTGTAVVTTSAVVTVTVFPQPVVTPTLIQASCTSTVSGFNLGLTFIPASPAPAYTITWLSAPNGILSPTQYSVLSGVLPGPYAATITAAGGCQLFPTFTLSPPPPPAVFSLTPFSPTLMLNCITPTIDISASNAAYNYTWTSNSSAAISGTNGVNLNSTNTGTWTVIGQNPDTTSFCTKTMTFLVVQDITPPTVTITPLTQVLTCTNSAITVSMTASPTINVTHFITDPIGGVVTANGYTAIVTPGSVGTSTDIITNLVNGCSITRTFVVTSTQSFPTYTLQSPNSFSVGCTTKSIAVVNIVGAQGSGGGAVTYTVIGPGTNTNVPSGPFTGGSSTYSLFLPGTYTAIVRQINTGCDTRSSFSILQNTVQPDIVASTSLVVLDCDHTVTTIEGSSITDNVSYLWSYLTLNVPSYTTLVNVNSAAPTQTLINNYTLTITDNSSTCKSTTVLPIYQNLFPPKAQFSLGNFSITCITPTIVLTNISISTVPSTVKPPLVPPSLPVVGYLWQGPTPQDPKSNSTTYEAGIPGMYTITAKDMNNGCLAVATQSVDDNRDFPIFSFSVTPKVNCGDTVSIGPDNDKSFPASAFSATWSTPGNAPANDLNKVRITSVKFPGTYSLTLLNTKNGCVFSNTVLVTNASLTANFVADHLTGYAPLKVNFKNLSRTDASIDTIARNRISSYVSFGNGTTFTTNSVYDSFNTVYTLAGTYSVALTVRKGPICIDTMVQYIKVELPSKIEVPNIFSPNGDGVNDLYYLNATNISEVTFVIVDRWGHVVFDLTSPTGNIIWDGKAQTGVECSEGTYFYTLKGKGTDGNTFDQKGVITLVR